MPSADKKAKRPRRRSSKQGLGRRNSNGSKQNIKGTKESGTYCATKSQSARKHQDSSKVVRKGSSSYQTNGRTAKQPSKAATKRSTLKKSHYGLPSVTIGLRRTEEHMDLQRRPALLRERTAIGTLGSYNKRQGHGPQSTLPSLTTRQVVLSERPVRRKQSCRGGTYELRSHSQLSGSRVLRRRSDCCSSNSSINVSN